MMNSNISSPQESSITGSINILFIGILFYNFIQWGMYETLSAKLIGLFVCFYIVNSWISTRSSFVLYSPIVFALDIFVIFIYANLPYLLRTSGQIWGYSSFFWFYIGLVELIFAFWDIIMRQTSPSPKGKKDLTFWTVLSFVSAASCWIVFAYQIACENNFVNCRQRISNFLLYGHLASAILATFLLWMIVKWNWNGYKASKQEGSDFFS